MKWLATVMCLLVASPTLAQSNDEILKRLEAIEKRLEKLEAAPTVGNLLDQAIQNAREPQKSGKADMASLPQPSFSAKLLKATFGKQGRLQEPPIDFSVAVTNNTGRDASLINARVVFTDKLGNDLGSARWADSKGIASGKTETMSDTIYRRMFDPANPKRLVDIDRSLLIVRFEVSKIAYADGEIVDYAQH
jgi:hypothetical protein